METVRLLLRLGAWNRIVAAIKSLLHLGVITTTVAVALVVINNLFDYVLYPVVLCRIGFWWGVIILAIISVKFNEYLISGFNWVGGQIVLFPWLWRAIGAVLWVIGAIAVFIVTLIANMVLYLVLQVVSKGFVFGIYLLGLYIEQYLVDTAIRWWGWFRSHVTFLAFTCLSAYDPVPAMLFVQQVYKVRDRKSLKYRLLFYYATIIANGVWATGVVLGLEAIQALDEDFFAFIRWSEEWTTWTAGLVGSSWQADFGFLRELLGTCKI